MLFIKEKLVSDLAPTVSDRDVNEIGKLPLLGEFQKLICLSFIRWHSILCLNRYKFLHMLIFSPPILWCARDLKRINHIGGEKNF